MSKELENYYFLIAKGKMVMALATTIMEKIGTDMVVNRIPVKMETLNPYLDWLISERGLENTQKLESLNAKELREAIKALYKGENLDAYLGSHGEDVMDHIERSDHDIENFGR